VLGAFPAGLRHAAATPGGTAWFWLSAAQRRAALDNYATVLGVDRSDPRVAQLAKRAFQNYGRMLMDFLLMGDLSPDDVNARVSVDGLHHLDESLSAGRGLILALPHMGSWDMAAAFASVQGYRISAVAERFPGSLDEAVISTRRRLGMEIIPLGRSAVRSITAALAANRMVALLCDRREGALLRSQRCRSGRPCSVCVEDRRRARPDLCVRDRGRQVPRPRAPTIDVVGGGHQGKPDPTDHRLL